MKIITQLEKFTPGPWRHVSDNGWDAVRPEKYPLLICKLVENNPANAALIAAAPELYEALKMTLNAIRLQGIDWQETDRPAYDQALAALKKARGES